MNMILLSLDITDLAFSDIITFLAVLIVIWFVVKNLIEMKDTSIKIFTRKQGWDKAARVIEEKEKVWDDAVADIKGERMFIVDRYDKRLDAMDKEIQQISEGLLVLTKCSRAILDGLHQLKCNGQVTEASRDLDDYLVGLVKH